MSSTPAVRRSATDVKLTGLSGGLAEHWGIDPVLVRVAFVLLTFSGGVGAVLYLAGWLLIPVQGHDTRPADELFGEASQRWPNGVWVALVILACLAVVTLTSSVRLPGAVTVLVIGCIWYFAFNRKRQANRAGADSESTAATPSAPAELNTPQFVSHDGPPTAFTEAADRWRRRIEEHVEQHRPTATGRFTPAGTQVGPQTPAATSDPDSDVAERSAFFATPDPVGLYVEPVGATAIQPPIRRRDSLAARRLRLLTVLVLGLVLAGLSVLDSSGVAVVPAVYAASALLVVGLALVAATWFGRARGLLAVGLLLVPVTVGTALAGAFGPVDHWSESTRTYSRVAELPVTPEELGSGRVTVDLSQLQLSSDATYRAHLGAGRLEVVVPPGANVEVRYDVDYGQVDAFGAHTVGGVDLVDTADEVAVPNRPTLFLDLAVDGGQLVVRR
nr:PspC domain-containing protein [uncultured Friedmanniella sp.]